MVKGAKGKTNDSFSSQLARNFLPLSVSVSKTHARPLSVERENNGPHSTQNKRKTIMYREPQFMYNCNDPNLEWSVLLTRPCAARSTRLYLEIGGAPRCTGVHN